MWRIHSYRVVEVDVGALGHRQSVCLEPKVQQYWRSPVGIQYVRSVAPLYFSTPAYKLNKSFFPNPPRIFPRREEIAQSETVETQHAFDPLRSFVVRQPWPLLP